MYVRFVPNKKNPKSLYYAVSYRDENGKPKQKLIEKIGDWEVLINQFDDPYSHFTKIAKEKHDDAIVNIPINFNENLLESDNPRNLGYCVIKNIFNSFKLSESIIKYQKNTKYKSSLDQILRLLVYSRIINPSSKLKTFNTKDMYFENFDFKEHDVYRSLDHICALKDTLVSNIWKNTKETYNRDLKTSYFDCTNYYFEIPYNDSDNVDDNGNIISTGLRKKGPSKEHRKTPIVQMGLLLDNVGLPVTYELFSGNESEKTKLRPLIKKVKKSFDAKRTIVVADRGLNTSDNIWYLAGVNNDYQKLDGYVYGQSIRGANEEFKKWVLNDSDYVIDELEGGKIFKHKSRLVSKELKIIRDNTRKNKTSTYQKQMVYYSEKYAIRERKLREQAIEKAKHLISNPGAFKKNTTYGCAKYVENLSFDKKTGEIVSSKLLLNEKLIEEEALFDGYYSIVTSEYNLSDIEIRCIYRQLWKIEETFKVTKSTLDSRPVNVSLKTHIEAHFLTCFISLVILRLLEVILEHKYSPDRIANTLSSLNCSHISHDVFHMLYTDELVKDIESKFNVDLSKKYINLKNIKKLIN